MGIYEDAVELLEAPLCEECPGRIYSVNQDVQHPQADPELRLNRIGTLAVSPVTIGNIARFSIANDIAGCEGPVEDRNASFNVICGAVRRINDDPTSPA